MLINRTEQSHVHLLLIVKFQERQR